MAISPRIDGALGLSGNSESSSFLFCACCWLNVYEARILLRFALPSQLLAQTVSTGNRFICVAEKVGQMAVNPFKK